MEPLKHECGVAMIRLLKPLDYYEKKYGSSSWALGKLYLLMEKQHNRGQEAAGLGVVSLHAEPGHEYVFRERAVGPDAIQQIFDAVHQQLPSPDKPFRGEILMGHLRYSTTGKSGMAYVHPFLRRNNWRSRCLMMCGNFNMTNVEELFQQIVRTGQHPRLASDSIVLLEQLGYSLDKENHRLYRQFRDQLEDPALGLAIEDNLDLRRVLAQASPSWDGGYVICGATGSGDMFALRDPHGIRPAFYYADDEVVVLASERPVIQTVMDVPFHAVRELSPGAALLVSKAGAVSVAQVNEPKANARCSFERIYFSRGSDADIYRERKALGRMLVPDIIRMLDGDIDNAVFSFIPNTAEVAYMGMTQELERYLDRQRMRQILRLQAQGLLTSTALQQIMQRKVRTEKIAIKDIKLRTFIAEGAARADLASHVYDVTYGCVKSDIDTLVVIDDSIVRGTTLRQSIIAMLDRLLPRRIIIVSSAPQVRFPDYYGIDMSRLAEFAAFRAAVALLQESGRQDVLDDACRRALDNLRLPASQQANCAAAVYEPFSYQEISAKIAEMLTPPGTRAKVDILFQTPEGLRSAVPDAPGDWYFSGRYPTPGGVRAVNQAFVNFCQGRADVRAS